MTKRTSYIMTEERRDIIEEIKQEADEKKNSGAIDLGLKSYLELLDLAEEKRDKIREIAREFNSKQDIFRIRVTTSLETQNPDL